MTAHLLRRTPVLIVLSALLVAGGRFTISGVALSWEDTYEAVAHLYAGVLIALSFRRDTRWVALPALIVLSLFEVMMFMLN
jgi:hypothetical protein